MTLRSHWCAGSWRLASCQRAKVGTCGIRPRKRNHFHAKVVDQRRRQRLGHDARQVEDIHQRRNLEPLADVEHALAAPPCVLALTGSISFQGSPNINAPNCGMASNDPAKDALVQFGRNARSCRSWRAGMRSALSKGDCQSACIAGQPSSRRPAGDNVPDGTLALVRSLLVFEQNGKYSLWTAGGFVSRNKPCSRDHLQVRLLPIPRR